MTGTVHNDSPRKRVRVLSVSVKGLPYRVTAKTGALRPGQGLPVTLTPTSVPETTAFGTVSVRFFKCDPLPRIRTRTFALRTEAPPANNEK